MHTEPPTAAGELLDLNCVVKIARIVRVNCDNELQTQILAADEHLRRNSIRDLCSFLQNGLRKLGRQMIFPDDRQDVDSRRRARTKDLNYFALRINVTRFPLLQPDDDLVAAAGSASVDGCWLNINVVDQPRIVRHHIEEIPRVLQGADKLFLRSRQNPDDPSFRSRMTSA